MRLLGINRTVSTPAPAATDPYYAYRSLILNFDGNFNDSSPKALTVTPYGDAQIVSDATFGTVASFDGAGDRLNSASSPVFAFGTGDFTVEFWVYFNAWPTAQTVLVDVLISGGFSWYINGSGGYYYAIPPNSLVVSNRLVGQMTVSWQPTLNTWYHFALSRSNTSMKMFVDGIQVGSVTASTNYVQGPLQLFTDSNVKAGPLRISPWAVYTSNFTPSQDLFPAVQQLPVQDPWYNKTSLILNMDGTPTSQIFEDDSPNALAVTAVGDAQIVSDATFGTVASFDGSGDYLIAPSGSQFAYGTGDFTWEFWFNASIVSGTIYLMDHSTSGNGGTIHLFGGILRYYNTTVGSSSTLYQSGFGTVSVNTWYHIAASRLGGITRLYKDGVLITSGADLHNYPVNRLVVGASGSITVPFNGKLGPFRITKGLARDPADFLLSPPSKFPTLYNPYTTLPVEGAALWLDAADDSTLFTDAGATNVIKSGDQVYQWNDKSGNNRHAVQTTSANRPTWLPPASGQNGFGATAYNGTNQFFEISNTIGWNLVYSGDFTIDIVHKATATGGVLLGQDNGPFAVPKWGFGYGSNGVVGSGYLGFHYNGGGFNGFVRVAWTPTAGSVYRFTAIRIGNDHYFYVNGVQQGSVQTTASRPGNPSVNAVVGQLGENYAYIGGPIYEISAYLFQFDISQLSQQSAYSLNKWGTP